jgi:hypothetical protein
VDFGLFCRIYAVKGKEISIFLQIKSFEPENMSTYEILPALDLIQSVHAKISIRMHQGGQILNFQNTLDKA